MSNGKLTAKNYKEMDDFLSRVLDGYKNGVISKEITLGGLGHVMAALDKQNTGEAISWFNQEGLEYFKDPTGVIS